MNCKRRTKKAEPPPTRGVNRDSGTASANGGWLRRLVRRRSHLVIYQIINAEIMPVIQPKNQPNATPAPDFMRPKRLDLSKISRCSSAKIRPASVGPRVVAAQGTPVVSGVTCPTM